MSAPMREQHIESMRMCCSHDSVTESQVKYISGSFPSLRPPSDPDEAAALLWDATDTMIDASVKATIEAAFEQVRGSMS